ncbi:TPA: hypothetical protein HA259_00950, partial [Thermoplasmata archaeon]|nr:hypothetical protein [Thermoplasmata archaeon]
MTHKWGKHVIVSIAVIVIVSFAIQPAIAGSGNGSGKASDQLSPTWRVLVYLDGDNNLDTTLGGEEVGVVETDLLELMEVGS